VRLDHLLSRESVLACRQHDPRSIPLLSGKGGERANRAGRGPACARGFPHSRWWRTARPRRGERALLPDVPFQLNSTKKKKSNRQTIFNFAESRRKKREKITTEKPEARVRAMLAERGGETTSPPSTSRTAFAVDAWARQSDEGRGDRRNVQGELHTSEEP
jgi:hypothetical protein